MLFTAVMNRYIFLSTKSFVEDCSLLVTEFVKLMSYLSGECTSENVMPCSSKGIHGVFALNSSVFAFGPVDLRLVRFPSFKLDRWRVTDSKPQIDLNGQRFGPMRIFVRPPCPYV